MSLLIVKKINRAILYFLVILVGSLGFQISSVTAQSVWTEDSFEDFRDGSFLDAGSNLYVSAKGRIQMITRWDFNNDGFLDIFLPSGHANTEKENTYIYLNNGVDIDGRSRIELPGGGSRDGVVADFDKDGFNDLAIANSSDSHFSRVNAWIYYGSSDGFSIDNRIELPAFRGKSLAIGDFNNDSWTDLAIACQWQAGTITEPSGPQMSFIYWNSLGGFHAENRLPLIFNRKGAKAFVASDLDHDGIDDLVALAAGKTYLLLSSKGGFKSKPNSIEFPFSGNAISIGNINDDSLKDIAIIEKKKVIVLFGNKANYSLDNSTELRIENPSDVTLADVNNDGYDDVIVANSMTAGGATWTDSYVFLSDGKRLSDPKTIALPTLCATGVSAGDLNRDGFPELVFSNMRVTNNLDVSSYVYWNDGGHFYFGNHAQLPTRGSLGNTIGDVDNDGLTDVIFFNEEGNFRDGPTTSYVYWGDGTRNFSQQRRTGFPTHHTFGVGHADLDDDGFIDLIMAQERFVYRISHEQNGLLIYWGAADKFSAPSRLTMTTAYGGVRIADINKDGFLDMVAGGDCVDLNNPEKHGIPIFWGSEKGLNNKNRTIIHHEIEKMRAPLLMDLNRDGWLDIAGQVEDGKIKIWWGEETGYHDENFTEIDLGRKDHLMYIKGADFNKDGWLDLLLPKRRPHQATNTSFIYYGSPDGFSNDRRTKIKSNMAYQNSIADFDKDGFLDIFLTSYGTDLTGNRPSLVHWGGANGFTDRTPTELHTYGASGSESLDYDGDGWIDIFVANHRKAGSTQEPEPHRHVTPSQLFWGGPDGFSDQRRWEVEAVGPSGLNLRDAGNSYDRGLYEDYFSSIHEIPRGEKPALISWTAQTPQGTLVKFQVRTADHQEDIESASWYGAKGINTWFEKTDSKIKNLNGKWIQYRARLITPNSAATPYLTAVSIQFE